MSERETRKEAPREGEAGAEEGRREEAARLVDRQDSPGKRHGDALRDGTGSRHGEDPGGRA